MSQVPEGFHELATAWEKQAPGSISVIGMVVDILSERLTPRGDYTCAFNLTDTMLCNTSIGREGLRVRFFASQAARDFPEIKKHGDILMVKDARVTVHRGEAFLLVDRNFRWWHFPLDNIPMPEFDMTYMSNNRLTHSKSRHTDTTPITLTVQKYIMELASHRSRLSSFFKTFGSQQGMTLSQRYPNATHVTAERTVQQYPIASYHHPVPSHQSYQAQRQFARPSASKRFRLIEDICINTHADMCVQVVKKWTLTSGCELHVTDYTENDKLWDYPDPLVGSNEVGQPGDDYGYSTSFKRAWPGPWGTRTMRVIAKPPHQEWADRVVETDDILRLQNVKITYDTSGVLEGTLWRENKYPDKILIVKMRDHNMPEVQDLLKRKSEYEISRQPAQAVAKAVDDEKISKNKKKRGKDAKRKEERRAAAREAQEQASKANQHVRCSHIDTPLTAIRNIRDTDDVRHSNSLPNDCSYALPFINVNYRAKVQVLDYKPDKLEDFAVPFEGTDDSSYASIESSQVWNWSFELLLTDVTKSDPQDMDRLLVKVGHKQAQFLLGNDMPDPADLRQDPSLLNRLRQKLCILWGDLEEQKTAGQEPTPSNRPFECCISEFGVLRINGRVENIEDWDREYMLNAVTIL